MSRDIKARLYDAGSDFNIPTPEFQKLEFNNNVLDNDALTLDDCGVKHGDTIKMLPSQIFVRQLGPAISPIVSPHFRL